MEFILINKNISNLTIIKSQELKISSGRRIKKGDLDFVFPFPVDKTTEVLSFNSSSLLKD